MYQITSDNYHQSGPSPIYKNALVEKGLNLHMKAKRAKECIIWGLVNTFILAILLYDLSSKCPYSYSNWYYVEYFFILLELINIPCYFFKYIYLIYFTGHIEGTNEQRCLLQFNEFDNSFLVKTSPINPKLQADMKTTSNTIQSGGINTTFLQRRHTLFNDSRGKIVNSMFNYQRSTSPQQQQSQNTTSNLSGLNSTSYSNSSMFNNSALNTTNNLSFNASYKNYSNDDIITDQRGIENYLKEVSDQKLEIYDSITEQNHNNNSMNSFWSYCNTAATLLKTSLYQLAPSTNTSTPTTLHNQMNEDQFNCYNILDFNCKSEVIRKISPYTLSKFVANLRMWMSITILQRLRKEMNKTDEAFQLRGFSDMKIGSVTLDRLKKTAENSNLVHLNVPMLPLIIPFLDMSTNQEYLVQRIKDMAEGSCIANYQWISSSASYLGPQWDEHLPTDSAILFHLFCAYLDSQLMPLPQPGGRPFFSRYVIIADDKKNAKEILSAVKNKSGCAILCTNLIKPKFKFISDNIIHHSLHDRNNLYYVIIQFLIYMRSNHEGLLEGVNLGKCGINILCIIDD